MLLQQLRWLRRVVPILLILLSGVFSYPAGSSRLRCYVCGGENEEPCGDLLSTPPETSLKSCPETSQGCLTQAEDKVVTRSCTDLKISDCKAANGKLYCYCETDACNSKPASISHTEDDIDDDIIPQRNRTHDSPRLMDSFQPSRMNSDCEEDDEDRCEGSGTQPEDQLHDHLIEAIVNAYPTSTTTTTTSPSTTTKQDTTTLSSEKTTKSTLEAPTDRTIVMTASETTPNPNKNEPSGGCVLTSLVTLISAAVVVALFGNVRLLRG